MHKGFSLRVAVLDGFGGEAEFAYDCEFNALVLRRFVEEELDAAKALGMLAHCIADGSGSGDGPDRCWAGPISLLPESSTAALLAEEPPGPLKDLDYVMDARDLKPEEMLRSASSVGCPYAPLLKRKCGNVFFPRVRWLDSKIGELAESGLEAAAIELGSLEDPAEVVSGAFASLKLISPDLAREEAFSMSIEKAFRPRTQRTRQVLEDLFERAEDALAGRNGIAELDADELTRYIGRMKPLAAVPGRAARDCEESERVRSVARCATQVMELAKARLAAGGRACERAQEE